MQHCSALHVCLPSYDNLGDRLGMDAAIPLFANHDIALNVTIKDIREMIAQRTSLDHEIDQINQTYDMVIIGAGGYLHPLHLLPSIFKEVESWSKLKIPLILFGLGVVNLHEKCPYPTKYALLNHSQQNHLQAALEAATAVSVRDVRSWYTSKRLLMHNDADKVFLTGCPTLFLTGQQKDNTPKTHLLALNIPFRHALCNQYKNELMKIASLLILHLKVQGNLPSETQPLKWICHSEIERSDAENIRSQLGRNFDIVCPKNFDETSAAFASCRIGLVTKGHAGIFSFANRVPFGFLSYDVKCDALLETLWDDAQDLLLYIHKLKTLNIETSVQNLINRIIMLSPKVKTSMDNAQSFSELELKNFFERIKQKM